MVDCEHGLTLSVKTYFVKERGGLGFDRFAQLVFTLKVNTRLLGIIAGLLTIIAIGLSFTGYPKLLEKSNELDLMASNKYIDLSLLRVTKDTTQHLLANSATFNITLTIEITAQADRRLENTNFYINCFDSENKLVNCTNGKIVTIKDNSSSFGFSRDWSRITKSPLDTTLVAESNTITYSPEFYGIDWSVKNIALAYTDHNYSRTDLTATTESQLSIPVDVSFAIEE